MSTDFDRKRCKPKASQTFSAGGRSYRIAGRVGNGAVGLVRKARDVESGAIRAVKFLAPDLKYIDPEAMEDVAARFRREGERGAGLHHSNLVRVICYEENSGGAAFLAKEIPTQNPPINPFVVMEYVDGRTLESRIRKAHPSHRGQFLATEDNLRIGVQIARALQYLHKRHVIHRDVKPANIYLGAATDSAPLQAKLGDFGVVKWGDFQASVSTGALTVTSQRGLGTLKYMSPEQAVQPKRVTVRSDVYSLGITLFELFTSQILPSPHHVFQVMMARLKHGATTHSRFADLRVHIDPADADLGEMVLNMHLRGAASRPAIERVRALLEWELRDRFDAQVPAEEAW
ncbi:MAG: serine/threonine-protein kinase [Planctomycetota bacterium]